NNKYLFFCRKSIFISYCIETQGIIMEKIRIKIVGKIKKELEVNFAEALDYRELNSNQMIFFVVIQSLIFLLVIVLRKLLKLMVQY
ncbi:hypothetical protein, partial [Chitinophaga sp.]|uniref:hypothetical protein n=1 Tax=Chitinophaga sp. TaxID=1869181 RepID=UPI002F949800